MTFGPFSAILYLSYIYYGCVSASLRRRSAKTVRKDLTMNHSTPPRCNYYVIVESRTNADNAITSIYGSFYMAFEVDSETQTVLKFSCTHTLDLTEEFLRGIFVGQSFPGIDAWLDGLLKRCYGGSSRRAVLTSYRDALKRYHTMNDGSSV